MSELLSEEMVRLICKIDLTKPENVRLFKNWQYNDGSLDGIKQLIEKLENQNAQRSNLAV